MDVDRHHMLNIRIYQQVFNILKPLLIIKLLPVLLNLCEKAATALRAFLIGEKMSSESSIMYFIFSESRLNKRTFLILFFVSCLFIPQAYYDRPEFSIEEKG